MEHSKLPHIGTTIFTVMSKLAADHQAINLSQGFPGFGCDQYLLELVSKYMAQGFNQYAPMSGVPQLKSRVAEKFQRCYGIVYEPEEEVTIVSGATESIYAAITCLVEKGDEVIILEPAYDSYSPAVLLCGGVPVFVPLRLPDFSVDWEKVKAAITDRTRAIMVNTPHNPSGYVWTLQDLNKLAELIRDKEIYIVSDEVYEHIIFDGRSHLPVSHHPELYSRTFVCGSFGKTFHVTGWKLGYCLAPKELTLEFRKIHQFITFSSATPLQYALAEYLEDPKPYQELPAFYQRKRDLFCEGLKETRFKFTPAQGSFFQLVSYGHFSDEPDYDMAVNMTKQLGVACIPVSVFYNDKKDYKLLRFCFAKKEEELLKALDRLISLE
jgi:methionine transaminase